MTATLAKSAAPPWAVTLWSDERRIYAEIPGKDRPYITTFMLNEGGLSKALSLLRTRAETNTNTSPIYRVDPSTIAHPSNRPSVGTAAQRANAQSILRKLGMIP